MTQHVNDLNSELLKEQSETHHNVFEEIEKVQTKRQKKRRKTEFVVFNLGYNESFTGTSLL
jgi:hypothetical protein